MVTPSTAFSGNRFFAIQQHVAEHAKLGNNHGCLFHQRTALASRLCTVHALKCNALASRKSKKKSRNDRKESQNSTLGIKELRPDEVLAAEDPRTEGSSTSSELLSDQLRAAGQNQNPNRDAVLKACVITSGLLLGAGLIIQQVSNVAAEGGWAIDDSSSIFSFDFETWHAGIVLGLVILISSTRYILLKIWPDFSESSEAANQQILSSLEPFDYVLVAVLPGISEEFLFRGALLPLFGLDWKGAFVTGAIFGALHLGSGRKYSYVIWATFVGFLYGLATISTSNILVPMASHSLNNLLGGLIWRLTSRPKDHDK